MAGYNGQMITKQGVASGKPLFLLGDRRDESRRHNSFFNG